MIDNILQSLEKVKPNGSNKWMACCPAHPDRSPSLAIKDDGERILLHCFAGCETEAIAGAMGMTMGDLFSDEEDPEKRQARQAIKTKEEIEVERLVLAIADSDRKRGKKLSRADLHREREAFLAVRRANEVV